MDFFQATLFKGWKKRYFRIMQGKIHYFEVIPSNFFKLRCYGNLEYSKFDDFCMISISVLLITAMQLRDQIIV